MRGKIVPLEAALLMLLAKTQASDIREAFSAVLNHKTLGIVLSESTTSSHDNCIQAVQSYYKDLHRQSNGLLISPCW